MLKIRSKQLKIELLLFLLIMKKMIFTGSSNHSISTGTMQWDFQVSIFNAVNSIFFHLLLFRYVLSICRILKAWNYKFCSPWFPLDLFMNACSAIFVWYPPFVYQFYSVYTISMNFCYFLVIRIVGLAGEVTFYLTQFCGRYWLIWLFYKHYKFIFVHLFWYYF